MFKFFCLNLILMGLCITTHAQEKTILIFDLESNSIDSLIVDLSNVDTTLVRGNTEHFIGTYDDQLQLLEEDYPEDNLASTLATSTARRRVSLDYNLSSFPIRTSVKTSYYENDTLKDLCSGNMISKRHILTAAHCHMFRDSNELFFDSILVCPVYDDEQPHPDFACHLVSKIYVLRDWELYGEDFVVLELAEDLGLRTGWLGIGFDDDDDSIEEPLYYKFAYPARNLPGLDSIDYNGDTLYYRYGEAKVYKFSIVNYIGFAFNVGLPGESGSAIIQVDNNENYISYGVQSFATQSFHNRITNRIFHLLLPIIQNDIDTSVEEVNATPHLIAYPNPTAGLISFNDPASFKSIKVYGLTGQLMEKAEVDAGAMDLSFLPNGIYLLEMIEHDNNVHKLKLIKNN